MEHTLCLDSSALNQSCVTASRAVTVDFPDWNPHCIVKLRLLKVNFQYLHTTKYYRDGDAVDILAHAMCCS